jgi:hypothetical protein
VVDCKLQVAINLGGKHASTIGRRHHAGGRIVGDNC